MLRMRSSMCKCARPMGHEISPRHVSQKADCAEPIGKSDWPMGVVCILNQVLIRHREAQELGQGAFMSLRFLVLSTLRFEFLWVSVPVALDRAWFLIFGCRTVVTLGLLRAYAMASLIDSEAHFSKRAGEVRLGDAALRTLRRLGLNSMGSLAYAHGQPGQPLDEASFTNWVQSTVDANVSLGDMSAIKRLLFESQTLVLAALREQVVNPDSAALKKVPEAEKGRRMKHLRDTLTGVLIEGPMEPGFVRPTA